MPSSTSGGLPARYGRRVDVPVVAGPRLWGSASAPSGRWRPPRRARVRHAERGQAAIAGREPYRALRGPRDRVALDLGEALLDDCTPFATRPPGSSAHTLNSAWVTTAWAAPAGGGAAEGPITPGSAADRPVRRRLPEVRRRVLGV
ncbi:MAG: hypothetical protein DIU60_001865 [Actinomycetes bacterium]